MPNYEAPFAAPNITPGASLVAQVLMGNRAADRADEYAAMEREAMRNSELRRSAEEKRKEEDEKYARSVAAFNALPALSRAAQRSIGMANANPYGVRFEEQQAPGPSLRESGINVMGGNEQYAQHAAQALSDQPVEEPQPVDPTVGQHSGAPTVPMGQHSGAPQVAEAPPVEAPGDTETLSPSIVAAQMFLGQPRSRQLFATYQGQRFEVPHLKETTGLGDKYDAIYRTMLEIPGVTQQHAMDKVLADYEKDQAEAGRGARLASTLGFRNTNREDVQAFQQGENSKYKLTFEQRKELTNIMARAKVAAAGAQPIPPGLATLVGMKEAGATDEEVYAKAADLRLTGKQVTQPIQNVVRNAAAAERAGQKREALTATDDRGNVIGVWKDQGAAKTGAKQIEAFHRVDERLQALLADIKTQGERSDWDPRSIQKRVSLAKSVVAALRPFNELSNTAAGQQMEEDILGQIGAPGHGWLWGANTEIVQHLLTEARGQHEAQLNTKLRPGGGSQLAPALGGPRHGQGGEAAHPAQAPVGETRVGPDGRTYRKVGPNNWQPVTQ